MTTLVLARKYRPRRFDEMVGQEHVVQALANALRSQRLHHAYLFTGTRGVGKTTVSRILAKSLNCVGPDGQGGVTDQPCGVCNHCRDIDAGRHVDYTELDAASNRGVEEIGQLLDQAVYKPVLARTKVYLIDEVHMLSSTAFNAMLKTLEEPPEHLKFVLATTDPQKLPITVLSRCLQFNLRPMAPETVREHLGRVLAAEAIPAEPGALRLLARAARGSMRDALSLTDQAIAYGDGALAEDGVRLMLGAVDHRWAQTLVAALADGDGATVVATVDRLRAEGLSAEGTLEEVARLGQQMALAQAVPGALDAEDPDQAAAAALALRLPADETQLLYGLALQGRAELPLAPDEFSGLLMVLLRFLAFRPVPAEGPRAAIPAPAAAGEPARPRVASSAALQRPAPPAVQIPVPVPPARRSQPAAAVNAAAEPAAAPPHAQRPTPAQAASSSPSAPHAPAAVRPAARREPPPWEDEAPHPADVAGPVSASAAVPIAPPGPAASAPRLPSSALAAPRAHPPRDPGPPEEPPHPVDAVWTGGRPEDAEDPDAFASSPPPHGASAGVGIAPSPRTPLNPSGPPPVPAVRAHEPAVPAVPASAAGTQPTVDAADPLPDDPQAQSWALLVGQLIEATAVTALHRELAWQAQCLALDPAAGRVRLRIDRETLRNPLHIERLQAALAAHWQRPVQLSVEAGPVQDSPARRDAAARRARQQAAEVACATDPLIQTLLERHRGARLLPGSLQPAG